MFKKFSIDLDTANMVGSTRIKIWPEDGKLHYSKKLFDPENGNYVGNSDTKDAVSDISVEEFNKKLEDLHFEKWKKEYKPEGIMFLDGEQWDIRLDLEEGKPIIISGDNAYPGEWKRLVKVIRSVVGDTGILE